MFEEWYVMLYITSSSYGVGNQAWRNVLKRVVACELYSIHIFIVFKISWYFGIDEILELARKNSTTSVLFKWFQILLKKICKWCDGDYANLSGYTKIPCYVTKPCWACSSHLHIYRIHADGKSLIDGCDGCACIVFTTCIITVHIQGGGNLAALMPFYRTVQPLQMGD